MKKIYKSKIDTWLLLVLVSVMAISAYACADVIQSRAGLWPLFVIAGLGIIVPLWLLLGTQYLLEAEQLTVRAGPFKWRIPLAEITKIAPTRNPLSSPALSLDRLRIEYGRGKFVLVSPRDKEQFVRDIEAFGAKA